MSRLRRRDNLGRENIYRLTSLPGINPEEEKEEAAAAAAATAPAAVPRDGRLEGGDGRKPRDAERPRRIKFSRCLSSRATIKKTAEEALVRRGEEKKENKEKTGEKRERVRGERKRKGAVRGKRCKLSAVRGNAVFLSDGGSISAPAFVLNDRAVTAERKRRKLPFPDSLPRETISCVFMGRRRSLRVDFMTIARIPTFVVKRRRRRERQGRVRCRG